MMFVEDDELTVVGTSATDEFVVRHMIGGRSDMLWLDSRNAFTADESMAKVMTEVEARIAAEGCRVTYKDQHTYVFDVVAKDQVEMLVKAASFSIAAEREVRERARVAAGVSPITTGTGGPPPTPAGGYDEAYERGVRQGDYSVDPEGCFVDVDGDRVEDTDYHGGFARRGYHKLDPACPVNRPKDPNLFDVKRSLDAFREDEVSQWTGGYEGVARALGCNHTDPGDGWHTSTAWWVEFHDGEVARVSDWDQSSTYDDELPEPDDIRDGRPIVWRIDGSRDGVARVLAALGRVL